MSAWKKLAQAPAGGDVVNVEDVFSNFVHKGNSSTQTITNGIDLAGEGGLVWVKAQSHATSHALHDSARGVTKQLRTNFSSAEFTSSTGVLNFYSDGFQVGGSTETGLSNYKYASWTFRKAPKFFDIVTYTGTGGYTQIGHNLGSTPGFVIVKRRDASDDWVAWHRSTGIKNYKLNSSDAPYNEYAIQDLTSTTFGVANYTNLKASENGASYVAYLFAHHNSDGDFGPTGDQDIIKCGSYTGNGSSNHFIDVGFEPQWLLIKRHDSSGSWWIWDDGRGFVGQGAEGVALRAETTSADVRTSSLTVRPSPTGFTIDATSNINGNNDQFIYIAIRRGPMAVPESGTDVFDAEFPTSSANPNFVTSFHVDAAIEMRRNGSDGTEMNNRLRGNRFLKPNLTNGYDVDNKWDWDYGTGYGTGYSVNTNTISWIFKRAPSFFDVVVYQGNGGTNTIGHNLGVAPEMIWIKNEGASGEGWHIGTDFTASSCIRAYDFSSSQFGTGYASTKFVQQPTATNFYMGSDTSVGASNYIYVAYLFASLDGVSKVGSYTGTGTPQTINCGFNPRFIIIKKAINGTGNWFVFDTTRGITTGSVPYLFLNTTDAEGSADTIDPTTNGFIVNDNNTNANTDGYIFLAIA